MIRDNRVDLSHVGSDGTFSGYAYLHAIGYTDEIVERNALEKAVERRVPKLLRNHDIDEPIGVWEEVKVDDRGLFVRGKLDMNVERARETASLMESGALNGLSLGYITTSNRKDDGKTITTGLELFEISIVTFPAMEEAVVDNMTVFQVNDRLSIDDKGPHAPRRTADGYIAANVRAARVGVQLYRGAELGRPDTEVIRVYRPPEEVFDEKSLRSYAHRPVTNDHPPVPVNSSNWKKFSVGQVGDEIMKDGEFVRVPMVLMDGAAIKDFEAGKKELSLGYTTEIDFTPGVTKDGVEYDAVQKSIRANHLAVVTAARGGPNLRIGDEHPEVHSKKEITMDMKTMIVDGISVQLPDQSMQIVQKAINDAAARESKLTADIAALTKQVQDAQVATAAAQAEIKKVTETKDAELAVARKAVEDSKLTPEKLDQMVKDRADVVTKAKAVVGDTLVVDGKSIDEIKKQVVDAHLGEIAKTFTADAVSAAFVAITSKVQTNDTLAPALRAHVRQPAGGTNIVDAAYKEQHDYLKNAWKTPAQH